MGDAGGVHVLPALALTFVTCLSWFYTGFPVSVNCSSPGCQCSDRVKPGGGRNVPSPRGDRARVLNHMKLTDSLLGEKGGILTRPSSHGKDVAEPPFLTGGRRGRSGPGQSKPASSCSCWSFSSSSSAPSLLFPQCLGSPAWGSPQLSQSPQGLLQRLAPVIPWHGGFL